MIETQCVVSKKESDPPHDCARRVNSSDGGLAAEVAGPLGGIAVGASDCVFELIGSVLTSHT